MTLSLRARLFLAFGSATAAALLVSAALTAREGRRFLEERAGEDLARLARLAAATLPAAAPADGWAGAAGRLAQAVAAGVTLVDARGGVVAAAPAGAGPAGGEAALAAALAGREGRALGRDAARGTPAAVVAVPVRGRAGLAALVLARPVTPVATLALALARRSVLPAILALLATVAILHLLAGGPVARVTALETAARRIGSGDTGARARERPPDELGRLGAAVNRMAGELRARLQALESARDARERTLAHMSDGVALLDAANRVVYANQPLATILGAPLPPGPGTPLHEFARFPEVAALVQEARAGTRTIEREASLWTPRPRRVRATASPLGTADEALLLVLHDLTEIELLNRARQDFVANVSHELKTPLTSVRGYAETLLDGGLEDAAHRGDFVRVIRDQAVRLEALVDDLLSLAELERPDTRLRREGFDLREVVEQQAAALDARARRAGLALAVTPGPPATLTADRARIEQVVANLLDNAIKYTERGTVTVVLGGDDATVWCEVRDTGPGIPEADLPRVFERFYRVDKARSREKGGTGLGLAIVKHIVALHGGAVAAESTPGAGSAFRFTLPRRPGAGVR